MDKTKAIDLMNKLGKEETPFFFMTSFDQNDNVILAKNDSTNLLYNINGDKNYEETNNSSDTSILSKDLCFNEYQNAFTKIHKEISYGNTYLTNLTFPVEIKSNSSLSEIFHSSKAKYKILTDDFAVFSPESFIKIKDNQISTFPMKGTIEANSKTSKQELLDNQKEADEHATIVDLLRNDLSKISTNVRVENFRYINSIKSSDNKKYYQASSKITGKLDNNYQEKLGDIIFSLLPAGSISGAPKKKTIEIINKVETYKRGFYTGIAGIFDGKNLDSCVLIRFIEKDNDKLIFKAGGGITYQSDINSEYKELLDKVYVPIS